jgi:hypothetical protein
VGQFKIRIMENGFHYPLLRTAYQGYYNNIPGLDRDNEEVNITNEEYIDYMDNWVTLHTSIAVDLYDEPSILVHQRLIEDLMYYAENYQI